MQSPKSCLETPPRCEHPPHSSRIGAAKSLNEHYSYITETDADQQRIVINYGIAWSDGFVYDVWTMTELQVQSVGAPPERHADRVVSEMISHLSREHAQRWEFIENLVRNPYVHDGGPKSQARLEAKVKAAGGVQTFLRPGKKGRYCLRAYSWMGWNPLTNAPITDADDIPFCPQLAHYCYEVLGLGKGSVRFCGYTVLIVSAHVLSRCVQRWQARTLSDLRKVIETIGTVALNYIADCQAKTDDWYITPPAGVQVPFPNT